MCVQYRAVTLAFFFLLSLATENGRSLSEQNPGKKKLVEKILWILL